ncbi:MAG: hypothetical protein FJ318_07535 [SAR202 cluster bacterium]|nr:hypothetical protein [SAR202 cluster bacterium]
MANAIDTGSKARASRRRAGVLAAVAAALAVGLIAYGAWVRASSSGLGCPDWPLCHGTIAPDFEKATYIEWGHRIFAGLVIAIAALALLFAHRSRDIDRGLFQVLLAAVAVFLLQAALGGIVVLTELNNLAVMLHLTIAMTALSLLVLASVRVLASAEGGMPDSALVTAVFVTGAAVILLGSSLVATNVWASCQGFPLCPTTTQAGPTALNVVHRAAGGVLLVLLAWMAAQLTRRDAPVLLKAATHGALVALLLQGVVGYLGVRWVFPEWVRVLHLGLAAVIWAGLSVDWAALVLRRRGQWRG